MTTVVKLADLPSLAGRTLGPSEAIEMSQKRIDAFADCTLDQQWIHVDPRRAAHGPFGTTIAHGLLTLSMLSHVMGELLRVEDAAMAINYGFDRIRFPAPVPSGTLVRGSVDVLTVTPERDHTHMTARVTFLIDGVDDGDGPAHDARPCCVADSITRFVAAT